MAVAWFINSRTGRKDNFEAAAKRHRRQERGRLARGFPAILKTRHRRAGRPRSFCRFHVFTRGPATPGIPRHRTARKPTSVQAMAMNAAMSDSPATIPDAMGTA